MWPWTRSVPVAIASFCCVYLALEFLAYTYGPANVQSLANTLTELLYTYEWKRTPGDFDNGDKLIFTVVGAFEIRIMNLTTAGLLELLRTCSRSGPSMDDLRIFDSSLGLFDNAGKLVLHMGWDHVVLGKKIGAQACRDEAYYFVHLSRAPYFPSQFRLGPYSKPSSSTVRGSFAQKTQAKLV
ncbi:hypothetical protein BS47DRAFT_1391485 [Hydnum rufescens UP504]|uniref:Uncharacterized protein n=1 Tax=Hydnum rufescens UP504 TaxID=1448309 RepID=A0A9P6DZ59_9AGAM|nr:hypothetical protein BS47DRAFT_1391485 [Hydnum rufescens UP504]